MNTPRRKLRQSGTLSLREFTSLADRVVDELPAALVRELNGGFVVEPGEKRDGDLVVLGEYIWDDWLGRRVVLYYGSFVALLGRAPRGAWERELRATVRHELRHHVEALAGLDDLAREDLEWLAKYKGD
ncbi:MAG: metallopeptidase family protein [Clostridia bacterium]|nr:metallopeptidase family protein [Clostridia bacterium]MDH7572874.1 metallopeptidase family protein [Clostridia bacterium]